MGMAVVNKPAYEFDIKSNDNLNECVSIKIKLKSNYNPNYIKLIGMVNIEIDKLLSTTEKKSWHLLFPLEK